MLIMQIDYIYINLDNSFDSEAIQKLLFILNISWVSSEYSYVNITKIGISLVNRYIFNATREISRIQTDSDSYRKYIIFNDVTNAISYLISNKFKYQLKESHFTNIDQFNNKWISLNKENHLIFDTQTNSWDLCPLDKEITQLS